MNFTQVHTAEHKGDVESYWICIYANGSALFHIYDNETGACETARLLDPTDDGSDIAICGDVKTWFDKELAAGRAKSREDEGRT